MRAPILIGISTISTVTSAATRTSVQKNSTNVRKTPRQLPPPRAPRSSTAAMSTGAERRLRGG